MSATVTLFFIIFLGQILLISFYYPKKFIERMQFVLEAYPPEEYPKFYPKTEGYSAEHSLRNLISLTKAINAVVIIIGVFMLGLMVFSDYEPSLKGGDEIFVMFYFLLQAIPHTLMEISAYKHLKAMHKLYNENKRTATLAPRRLFDFVSPFAVGFAGVVYVAWLAFFIYGKTTMGPWNIEGTAVVLLITGLNILYVFLARKSLHGKKVDPYQTETGLRKTIGVQINVFVYSSIGMSCFIALTQAADMYNLELYDPVFTSGYFQLIVIFGMGLVHRSLSINTVDFSVYKETITTNVS